MQLATIGTKNQIVIPKEIRRKVAGFTAGRKVAVYPIDRNTLAIKIPQDNWLEGSYGAMKKAWQNIDPIKELEKMRNEW